MSYINSLWLKPPCYVELESINDLARFACALERMPSPVYSLRFKDRDVLALQAESIMERLIFYYIPSSMKGEFLAYKISGCTEEVVMFDILTNPSYSYSPVISISSMPEELISTDNSNEKCKSIKLKDLNSISKISSYKMLLDEAALPLFFFKDNGRNILGTFLSIDDIVERSYFYYVELDELPGSFVKYSSQALEKATFTNRIDEHGYLYTKVIRLKEKHPLIE